MGSYDRQISLKMKPSRIPKGILARTAATSPHIRCFSCSRKVILFAKRRHTGATVGLLWQGIYYTITRLDFYRYFVGFSRLLLFTQCGILVYNGRGEGVRWTPLPKAEAPTEATAETHSPPKYNTNGGKNNEMGTGYNNGAPRN